MGGGKGGGTTGQGYTHRYSKFMSRIVRLSYLQTLQVTTDQQTAGEIAGETESTSASSQLNQGEQSAPWWDPLDALGNNSRSKNWSYNLEDSGWSISRTWLETFWDKIRYGIGLREITAYNFRFSPASEFVSIPFSSPKEIIKIQLQVEESIPQAYGIDRRWIEYYITINDGKSWIRINPLDHPTLYINGAIAPRTVNLNIDMGGPPGDDAKNLTTDKGILSVRFRAVFFTDETVLNGDRYTPVLKKYRLKLYPRGGLSNNQSGDV